MATEKQGFLDKQRARFPWLDHLVVAAQRYEKQGGDFYSAGITYFSILSIVPMCMVAVAIFGVFLAKNPVQLEQLQNNIVSQVPPQMAEQISRLISKAVDERNTVGLIGLLAAGYSGVGWMTNLREGLSKIWDQEVREHSLIKTKIVDLIALVGLLFAFAVSFGLSAVGNLNLIVQILDWLGITYIPGTSFALWIVARLIAVLASWWIFMWIIGYLPREKAHPRSAFRAAFLCALTFEAWKYIGTVYLQSVLTSPAGATFGPILGIMVFLYITWRIVLFFTAWAATTPESLAEVRVPAPRSTIVHASTPGRRRIAVHVAWILALGIVIGSCGREKRLVKNSDSDAS